MGSNWSMGWNSNTRGVYHLNQLQMRQCRSEVASRRRIAVAIMSLVNARGL